MLKDLIVFFLKRRIIRFGMVGVTTAIVGILIIWVLVHFLALNPLVANIFSFFIAFIVSFLGHHFITFYDLSRDIKKNLPKFFLVAILGFTLNEGIFALLLHAFHIYYLIAIVITILLVAIITFIISRFWAFK